MSFKITEGLARPWVKLAPVNVGSVKMISGEKTLFSHFVQELNSTAGIFRYLMENTNYSEENIKVGNTTKTKDKEKSHVYCGNLVIFCPKWLKIIGCKTITGFKLDYSFRSVLTPIAKIWAFPLSGMVHGLHIRLPVWKIEPAVVHQNLQQVLSIGKCGFILRAHIPDF